MDRQQQRLRLFEIRRILERAEHGVPRRVDVPRLTIRYGELIERLWLVHRRKRYDRAPLPNHQLRVARSLRQVGEPLMHR